jgi:hypothetical protein
VRIDQILVWTVRPSVVAEHPLPERHDPASVGRARDDREALDCRWLGGEPELAGRRRDRSCEVEVALHEAEVATFERPNQNGHAIVESCLFTAHRVVPWVIIPALRTPGRAVHDQRARYVITRRGKAVAVLAPVETAGLSAETTER